jgi:hypothetical protein
MGKDRIFQKCNRMVWHPHDNMETFREIQRVHKTPECDLPGLKLPEKAGFQWLMPVILPTQEAAIRRIAVQGQPRANSSLVLKTLSQKHPTPKRAGRMAQVVEYLPSKCEALSSNPSSTNNNRKKLEKA